MSSLSLPSRRAAILLLAGLLLPSLAGIEAGTITEGTTGQDYLETFEAYNAGAFPSTRPEDTWQAHTTTGAAAGSSAIAATTGINGAKAWSVTDGATPAAQYAAQIRNTGTGVDLCQAGQSFAFSFNHPGSINIGATDEYRVSGSAVSTTAQPVNTLGVVLTGASGLETVTLYVRGSGTAVTSSLGGVYATGSTVNVFVSQVNCGGAGLTARFELTGGVTATQTLGPGAAGTCVCDLDRVTVASTTATSSGTTLVDDIAWNNAPLPAPTVAAISPASGSTAGGTAVTLTGTGFKTGATATVGGVPLTGVTVVSATQITGTTGAHAAGTVSVIVTNPDAQTGTLTNGYSYQTPPSSPPSIPTVTLVDPDEGPTTGGTAVTVHGTNFRAGALVYFDGVLAADIVVTDSTHIAASTPPHIVGAVPVTVTNTDATTATKPNAYTYTGGVSDPGGFGTPETISTVANGGRTLSVAATGNTAVVFHTGGTGNAEIATVTQDAGATWDDYVVTPAYSATDTGNFLHDAAILDDLRFIQLVVQPGSAAPQLRYTLDGGQTWGSTAGLQGQCGLGGAVGGGSGVYLLICATTSDSIGAETTYSTDGGVTWQNTATDPGPVTADFHFREVKIVSATNWIVYGASIDGTAVNNVPVIYETEDSGSTWVQTLLVDPINPVPNGNYGRGIQASGSSVAFRHASGSGGELYADSGGGHDILDADALVDDFRRVGDMITCGDRDVLVYKPAITDGQVKYVTMHEEDDTNVFVSETAVGGTSDSTTTNPPGIFLVGSTAYIAYRDATSQQLTLLARTQCGSSEGAGREPDHTLAVSVQGLDVDRTGSVFVLRSDPGDEIRVGDAATLELNAVASYPSDCSRLYGVNSLYSIRYGINYVTFLTCNGVNQVDMLRLRDADLGGPTVSDNCQGQPGFCTGDFASNNLAFDIMDVSAMPYDYGLGIPENQILSLQDWVTVSFLIGTTDGRIFVQTEGMGSEVCCDYQRTDSQLVDNTGGTILEVCNAERFNPRNDLAGSDSWGQAESFAYARSSTGIVRGYYVTHTKEFDPNFGEVAQPHLKPAFSNPTATAGAVGIACGGSKLLVATDDGDVRLFDVETHTVEVVATGLDFVPERGVGMDATGKFAAYVDGETVVLFRTENVTLTYGRLALPSGTTVLRELDISELGQSTVIGIPDVILQWNTDEDFETADFTPDLAKDNDGDGKPNNVDGDLDGDGIPNNKDTDIDGDGTPNSTDTDDDDDGIPDQFDTTPGGGGTNSQTDTDDIQQQGGIGGAATLPGVDICALAASAGVSCDVFKALSAVMIMLSLAAGAMAIGSGMGGEQTGKMLGGFGLAGGLVLDLFLGLMPLWLVVAIVILGLAVIFFVKRGD